MVKYKEKTQKVSYDGKKVDEVLEFLRNNFGVSNNDYSWTRETASKMNEMILNLLETIQVNEIYIDAEREETEDEAKAFFGEEFIKKFEEIRKMCEKCGIMLAIHGTDISCAQKIQNQGLHYKNPQLLSTTVLQTGSNENPQYEGYSNLLNWPHRQYKGLVLIGVPQECAGGYDEANETGAKPLWEYKPVEGEKSGFEQEYTIKPEFIIGYIDVENRSIVENSAYRTEHDYTGLIRDTDIAYKLYPEEKEETDIEYHPQTTNDWTYSEIERSGEERILIAGETLLGTLCNLQRFAQDGLLKSNFTEYYKEIRSAQDEIEKALPNLKTNKQIDEKIAKRKKEEQEYQEKLARGEISTDDWEEDWDFEEL